MAAQLQVARALLPKEKEVKALGTIEAHHTITGAVFISISNLLASRARVEFEYYASLGPKCSTMYRQAAPH